MLSMMGDGWQLVKYVKPPTYTVPMDWFWRKHDPISTAREAAYAKSPEHVMQKYDTMQLGGPFKAMTFSICQLRGWVEGFEDKNFDNTPLMCYRVTEAGKKVWADWYSWLGMEVPEYQ